MTARQRTMAAKALVNMPREKLRTFRQHSGQIRSAQGTFAELSASKKERAARHVFMAGFKPRPSTQLAARLKDARREIPRLRVPALRAKAKTRDTPLGMTA
jgi:hypothetical protein